MSRVPEDEPRRSRPEEPEAPSSDPAADGMEDFFDSEVREPSSIRAPEPAEEAEDLHIVRHVDEEFAIAQVLADLDGNRPKSTAPPPIEPLEPPEPLRGRAPQESTPPADVLEGRLDNAMTGTGPDRTPASRPVPPPGPPGESPPPPAVFLEPLPAAPMQKTKGPRRPGAPFASLVGTVAGLVVLGAASVLAAMHVEPVHTWYYVFAWYPFLLAVNHLTARRSWKHSVFMGRSAALLGLLAWSVPVWLVFEAFNFRLQNWYYVGVPQDLLARRAGVIVSFATVLPGVLLLEETLRLHGAFARLKTPGFSWRAVLDQAVLWVGVAWLALVLAAPDTFYPLVWGIPVLLIDPWLRRRGGPSLSGDLAEGNPRRIVRLLVAGMIAGLWWEAANTLAGGRWIYTVPGLDALRPFEMPAPGFLGFPPFALCLWVMARALVQLGLLPDWETLERSARRPTGVLTAGKRRVAIAGAAVFTLAMLAAMDRWTVDSTTATAAEVPGVPDGIPEFAEQKGRDSVRGLLALIEAGDLYVPGESSVRLIEDLRRRCHLALLNGIGTENVRRLGAVGVGSIEELAAREAGPLTAQLDALAEDGWRPRERRVAAWIHAARKESPVDMNESTP